MTIFARRLGISHANVSRYEADKLIPSASVLLILYQLATTADEKTAIAAALGGAPDDYFDVKAAELSRAMSDLTAYMDEVLAGNIDPRLDKLYQNEELKTEVYVRLVKKILRSGRISPSLLHILGFWADYSHDLEYWKPFEEAAEYLKITLEMMAKRKAALAESTPSLTEQPRTAKLTGPQRKVPRNPR